MADSIATMASDGLRAPVPQHVTSMLGNTDPWHWQWLRYAPSAVKLAYPHFCGTSLDFKVDVPNFVPPCPPRVYYEQGEKLTTDPVKISIACVAVNALTLEINEKT